MKFGKILHLGIVVEDVEKASKIYEEVLGIGPWEIMEASDFFDDKVVNDGYGLHMKTAMFHGDGYEIELINPTTDEGVFADWLREKGPSLHHIKFECADDPEDIVAKVKEVSGRDPYLHVAFPNGGPTIVDYADLLQECGLLLEVNGKLPPPPPLEEILKDKK